MNNIEHLKWDSDFFGFNVGRIHSNSVEYIEDVILDKKEMFTLYYVFTQKRISNNFIKINEGKLVDEKVILEKELSIKHKFDNNRNKIYENNYPNKELYNLAYISGEHSRFKIDERLPKNTFKKMYNLWIERSCLLNKTKVFVNKINNKITGFITLNIKDGIGIIGLIAVDDTKQGLGIGTELILATENYLIENKINKITVATQNNNINALNFYKKIGYKIQSITNIYHFIKNNNENTI